MYRPGRRLFVLCYDDDAVSLAWVMGALQIAGANHW
jgi:hypothetical protein